MEQFIKDNIGWLGLGTVGLSSMLLGGWGYVKGFFLNTWRKLFMTINISEDYQLHESILTNLFINYKRLEFGKISLDNTVISINGESKYCIGEKVRDFIIFYRKGRVIILSNEKDKEGRGKGNSITTLRIGFDLKKFVLNSYAYYLEFKELNKSFSFLTLQGEIYSRDNRDSVIGKSPFEDDLVSGLFWIIKSNPYNVTKEDLLNSLYDPMKGIFLNKNAWEILTRIDTWYKAKDFYKEREIPWKLSFLLHGKGGTGKTSFITRIAKKYQMTLYRFDLATFNNRNFVEKWDEIIARCKTSPAIILFEDFDNVFQGRENVASKTKSSFEDGLTFDCILNCMSGVTPNDGVLLFITTNKIETIDEAIGVFDSKTGMSTRPGRIDYVYEFGAMEEEPRREMINFILHGLGLDLEEVVRATEGMTGVQVQKYCSDLGSEKLKEGVLNENNLDKK